MRALATCVVGAVLTLAAAACRERASASTDAGPPTGVVADAASAAREAPAIKVGEIVVDELGWAPGVGRPDLAEVRERVRADLAGTSLGGAGLEGRLKVRIGAAAGEGGAWLVAVVLELAWREDGVTTRLDVKIIGERAPDSSKPLADLLAVTLDRAVGDALALLLKKDGIRRGELKAVLAALDDPDEEVHGEALRAIAERRLEGAIPRLVDLLGDEREDRRDAALGALVALRARGAVRQIVARVEFQDLDGMRRVIDAVGEIGGDEAESYLELVAGGHDLPGVRALAAQALARLRARKQAAAGVPPP